MIVLGIDTVFHSTCISIMEDDKVLCSLVEKTPISSSRSSLVDFAFNNVKSIGALIRQALDGAGIKIEQINLISVTNHGSLLSSVISGVAAANTIGAIYGIPIIGVDHHEAHIYSNWLENDENIFEYPILVFSASGAHSSLSLIRDEKSDCEDIFSNKGMIDTESGKPNFVGLGTLYSDVSLMLGMRKINTPGNDGALVSEAAKKGHTAKYDFFINYPDKKSEFWNFLTVKSYIADKVKSTMKKDLGKKNLVYDIAACFEMFVAKLISDKLLNLSKKYEVKEVHFVGGVASNDFLRKFIANEMLKKNIIFRCPAKKYCVDNAAMIANLGRMNFIKDKKLGTDRLAVKSDMIIDRVAIDQHFKKN